MDRFNLGYANVTHTSIKARLFVTAKHFKPSLKFGVQGKELTLIGDTLM
jgi:hypothetical protein